MARVRIVDIGHPSMWRHQNGNLPIPFTMILPNDIKNGIWRPRSGHAPQNLMTKLLANKIPEK